MITWQRKEVETLKKSEEPKQCGICSNNNHVKIWGPCKGPTLARKKKEVATPTEKTEGGLSSKSDRISLLFERSSVDSKDAAHRPSFPKKRKGGRDLKQSGQKKWGLGG